MKIFPGYSEILVSPFTGEEVTRKLLAVTKNVNYLDGPVSLKKTHLFNGKVDGNHFYLSLIIHKADSFLPLIKGKIEPVKSGCILFLNYSLFPASVFFLSFWGVIALLATLFFIFHEGQWLYAVTSLLIGAGNFAFAWSYFKGKLKKSQLIFHQMLSLQEKDG